MEEITKIVKENKCTGCSACLNICPTGAIKMSQNSEGFLVPQVDLKKCINCGLCDMVCPCINRPSEKDQFPVPEVYAGWNKDEKIRLQSSSGGVFSLLAEFFIKRGGYVCGACFDVNNKLKHVIISDKRGLKSLRGSKYVQSEKGDIFNRIKLLLENDKWVLFSGTPCEAAGLRNFLRKEYQKLLILDIICHGVPSPLLFEKYLKEIEENTNTKIKNIKFRDKTFGWKNPYFILSTQSKKKLVKKVLYDDLYGRGFLTNLSLRPSCTDCLFSTCPKTSDITLGDFWGISQFKQKLDDDKGTSLIMINNEKGKRYIEEIKPFLQIFNKVPIEVAINNNYPVYISSDKHVNREDFYKNFSKGILPVSKLLSKYLEGNDEDDRMSNHVGILNFHYENHNFGANLVAFSLLKSIEKMGYKAKIINYCPLPEQSVIDKACSLNFYKFRQNFLKMTKLCKTARDLEKLNTEFSIFLTGSDQVWRQLITGENALHYFLDFALPSKKLISYGASFGHNYWDGDKETTRKAKEKLNLYKAISVREKQGLEVLNKYFGIKNATCVLDPTLLLSQEDYEELVKYSDHKIHSKKYIAYYYLFDNEGKIQTSSKMREILSSTGYELINVRGKESLIAGQRKFVYDSISDFLSNIKNSSFVITDSYHGVIFSILYKKNFICVGKKSKALSRFEDLFSILDIDISGRFLSDLGEVKDYIFSENIDYEKIYKNLEKAREESLNFLKSSLREGIDLKENNSILEQELLKAKFNIEDQQIQFEFQRQIRESQLQELQLKNQNSEANLQRYQESLKNLENSKSWKITKPLRKITHLFILIKQQGVKQTIINIFLKIKEKIFRKKV